MFAPCREAAAVLLAASKALSPTEGKHQMLHSDYRQLCAVRLPYFGRQKYMHSFDLAAPKMADGFDDYLEPVKALCKAAGALAGTAHMTVDEKVVLAGESQRRPGPHVDGCFVPEVVAPTVVHHTRVVYEPQYTGGGFWGHGGGSGWLHCCNDIKAGPIGRMAVIVASNEVGCRVWRGVFEGKPKSDGDLEHIRPQLDGGVLLRPNVGYLLSPDCVHESIRMDDDTQRTFLRIALPLDFRF